MPTLSTKTAPVWIVSCNDSALIRQVSVAMTEQLNERQTLKASSLSKEQLINDGLITSSLEPALANADYVLFITERSHTESSPTTAAQPVITSPTRATSSIPAQLLRQLSEQTETVPTADVIEIPEPTTQEPIARELASRKIIETATALIRQRLDQDSPTHTPQPASVQTSQAAPPRTKTQTTSTPAEPQSSASASKSVSKSRPVPQWINCEKPYRI